MGWLSRKYGLQTNAVTAFELVTAEGSFLRVDGHDHPPADRAQGLGGLAQAAAG